MRKGTVIRQAPEDLIKQDTPLCVNTILGVSCQTSPIANKTMKKS